MRAPRGSLPRFDPPKESRRMNRLLAVAAPAALVLLASTAFAADPPVMDETSRMNYALGYQIGRDLAGSEIKSDALLKGLNDGSRGTPPALKPDEMQAALTTLQTRINEQRAREQADAAKKAAAAGTAFLAENAKKPGVTTTKSGLQYKVIKPGTGRSPGPTDTVTVQYRGTLVDGQQFDSSYDRGEPATFPVNGVIAGWTEALQLMKEGAQYQLVIPAALAYADRGPLAGQVLVFDVELLKVGPPQPAKTGK
jgi:FKBP-type peptidyl-prolyl cis-trans isomerase FklB